MHKKDYKLIAKAFAEARDTANSSAPEYTVGINVAIAKVCDALLVDNAKFNKGMFLEAIINYQVKG